VLFLWFDGIARLLLKMATAATTKRRILYAIEFSKRRDKISC